MNHFNICFNCEYALSEPHKFCPNCGAQLNWQLSTPIATDNQNAPHQTDSNSVEPSPQSNVQNEHIHPTETSSHSNTNNTEAPTELKSNSYAGPTVEIRLNKPSIINTGVSLFLGFALFFSGIRAITGIRDLAGDPSLKWLGWIFMLVGLYLWSKNLPLRVKKQCPHCSEKNEYLASRTSHQCTFCQRHIDINWI